MTQQQWQQESEAPVLWTPSRELLENCQMAAFIRGLEQQGHGPFADYQALHQWSVSHLETFWQAIWEFCGLVADEPASSVLGKRDMPGAQWFPGMKLNFAGRLKPS